RTTGTARCGTRVTVLTVRRMAAGRAAGAPAVVLTRWRGATARIRGGATVSCLRTVVDRPVVSRDSLIRSTGAATVVCGDSVTGKRGTVISRGLRVITVPSGPRWMIVSTGSVVTSRVITVCAWAAPAPATSASATAAWRKFIGIDGLLDSSTAPKRRINH